MSKRVMICRGSWAMIAKELVSNKARMAFRLVGLRHELRAPAMCPLKRIVLEAQLDALLMLFYTALEIDQDRKNKKRGFIGTGFDPFTGNSDGS